MLSARVEAIHARWDSAYAICKKCAVSFGKRGEKAVAPVAKARMQAAKCD